MSTSERDPRRWFAVAMLLVLLHGAFYAVAIPPWDLFDEEQHLDYVLTLRDERRIPRLQEAVRPELVRSAFETDRWTVFQIGRPASAEPEDLGLEGRSFQGYQPPLYYSVLAPLTLPAGDRALPALYLARALGPLLLVVLSATAWAFARRWFPERRVWTPFSAAVMTGAIPATAEAAGRVNNDLLVATLISLGLLATLRMIDQPDPRRAAIVGLIVVAAVLTKSSGLLLLGLVGLALGIVWRRGRLSSDTVLAALGPGVVVLLVWTAFIRGRYGTWTGTNAFLDLAIPFDPLPVGEFLARVWLNGWSSYWGAYDGGWLRVLIGVSGLAILGVAAYGLARTDEPRRPYAGALFTGVLGVGLLAVLWAGNASGLVHPHGRIMLPVYPMLAAMTAGGWARINRRWAPAPAMLACVGALISAGFWFLPFFYGATS